jgi:hypothetical protein
MKNKKALVIDYGLFTEPALRLLRDCAEVKYYSFWERAFVDDLSSKIGEGFDGLERVDNPWPYIDKADFIFVPDTLSGGLVEFLKSKDYPVAGAGLSERVENDRWYGRTIQVKNDLPVQYTEQIIGISKLKEFCKNNKNFFIKIDNSYRGISESFKHSDLKSSEPRIDYIAYKTGPFKEDVPFICEELLEGVEPGIDGITFDGELLYPTMLGYEKKGCGYISRSYSKEELPINFKILDQGLSGEFKKNKTRFFYSMEAIIGKDQIPYLLDPTIRLAAPGTSAVQTELIENYSEVVYGLATGNKISPIMKYKYGAAISMESSEASKTFLNITFPKDMRQWVKFRMACKKGNDYYSVPPFDSVCCVIAIGQSTKEVVLKVLERAEEVKGTCLNSDEGGLLKILDDIEEGKKLGINF